MFALFPLFHHFNYFTQIRSTEDYVNYVRGDRIPSPPPIQKFDQQIPTLASPTRSFSSPEPVLKGFIQKIKYS